MASSSSETRPYEVFISFRGEDTRNNFVSHLHSALERRGIITYFDENNLQNGQTIAIELVKAIQESAIAIIVLSKNYGTSTWCLNELVKIVEFKNNLIIFPIFYDVDPSDVRKQQNTFFKAFSVHEVNFKDKVEMVNSWREALREVANLTGVDLRGKNEASCTEKIADEILWKLPLETSHFTESLAGMKSRISDIKILINKNSDEVRFIGFWGMGGVGKTTTARAIFEECESEFEGGCFLHDVRQNKKKDELVKLQRQLLSEVLKCPIEGLYDVVKGSSMIRKRMCRKRVLLVVDDVDDTEQLNVLVGQCSWFGKGSRIIITTRNEQLLNKVHDRYEVGTLNAKEALLLFRDHAFESEPPQENYMKLSHEVLRYAGGLPLALKVLGDHLCKRKESFWLDTLKRLKDVPEKKIISTLQISFDEGLKRNEQDIFLYIACFFRGEYRDSVTERLRSLGLYPEEGIKVLIQRSLIESRDDTHLFGTLKSFEMHDLLQDMGRHIVRQRANWEVRRYSYLWLAKDIKKVLFDHMGIAEAEGIVINCSAYIDVIEPKLIKEESFMNMNKLRFLKINEYDYSRDEVNIFESSVQLPNGLRCLCWSYYPGKYLATHPSIPMMNLVHLEMRDSLIESTPDFDHMPNLEVLDLRSSEKLVHIHPNLGLHTKIRRINLSYCSELKEFPAIILMDSLESLNLSSTSLQSFPEIYGIADSLKELSLDPTNIKDLPISFKNAIGLQKLELGYCYFTTVPDLPSSLQILKMRVCPALTHLLEYPKRFPSHLQTLKITDSRIEKTLDFNQLPNLVELNLSGSRQLSEVHASLGVHKTIVHINLQDCRNLCYFPTIVDMRCLETLNLWGTKLQCFPEITGRVDNLAKLDLAETCIRTLPQSIGHATGLKWLNLSSCGYLFSLPISLESLEELKIIPDATMDVQKQTV